MKATFSPFAVSAIPASKEYTVVQKKHYEKGC